MESRYYKDDLKDMILDMAHKELGNLLSQKGAQKYFEGNIDKVINNYIKKISKYLLSEFKNIFGKNEIFLGIFCFVVFPILNLILLFITVYIIMFPVSLIMGWIWKLDLIFK